MAVAVAVTSVQAAAGLVAAATAKAATWAASLAVMVAEAATAASSIRGTRCSHERHTLWASEPCASCTTPRTAALGGVGLMVVLALVVLAVEVMLELKAVEVAAIQAATLALLA